MSQAQGDGKEIFHDVLPVETMETKLTDVCPYITTLLESALDPNNLSESILYTVINKI